MLKKVEFYNILFKVQICNMTKQTIQQKKDYAKLLYTVEGVTIQKELAERVGVSKQSINKWVNEENWESLRASVIITKEQELKRLYAQMIELNDEIAGREQGKRYAGTKDADVLVKLTAAIRQLETDTSIAQIIEALRGLVQFVQLSGDFDKAKLIMNEGDAYVKSMVK